MSNSELYTVHNSYMKVRKLRKVRNWCLGF